MVSSLEDLARHIRSVIPYPHAILQLRANASAGGVTFLWNGTEFFVKPTFQVLEVRGNSLFITGLSTLLQAILMSADLSGRRFDAALEALSTAEDLARVHNQPRQAAQSLAIARQMLERMTNRAEAAVSLR